MRDEEDLRLLEYTGRTRLNGLLEGDRDEEVRLQKEQRNAAEEVLAALGGLLEGADSTLTGLEDSADRLPSAILRGCRELADGIAGVADRLEGQSLADQKALAEACARDASYQHDLWLRSAESATETETIVFLPTSPPSEGDFLEALQGASSLLRDVEASFREISEADAGDIADAALALARLFLVSLQSVYETLTPDDLLATLPSSGHGHSSSSLSSVRIEHLDDQDPSSLDSGKDIEDSTTSSKERDGNHRRRKRPRMRILWPPLGPHVEEALQWGAKAATAQPFLAVALGLTLWPAAIATSLVGGSLVVVDHALQSAYQHFGEHPLLEGLEEGAAQAVRAGTLGIKLGWLVGKQSLRVAQRQIDRHGGLETVAHNLRDATLDRITHPIESLGMAWNGAAWGVGRASDAVREILLQREELHEWMASQPEGLQ